MSAATKYDPKRDLHPHRPAVAAMWLWSKEYAKSGLGSMGFWDRRSEYEQNLCRRMVGEIEAAQQEAAPTGEPE